jgi:hypothetical protein
MSTIEKKKKVKTTIAAYTSWIQKNIKMPDESFSLTSMNNKNEIIPYLLDILKVIVGTDALKEAAGELFGRFVDTVEPKAKDAIEKQLSQPNGDDPLPNSFITSGITINVANIDVSSKFKVPTDINALELLHDDNTESFDNIINNAIANENTEVVFGNVITIKYDSTDDKITIKPITEALTIGGFLLEFLGSMIIINKKELLTNVMNAIYGTISSINKKTIEETRKEIEIHKIIEQIIDGVDNEFEINPNDNDKILQKAEGIANGITYENMGCGMLANILNINDLKSLVEIISGSTDPFIIGNAFDAVIEKASTNAETTKENRETIKDGFFQKLIKALAIALGESVSISPQIRTLLAVASSFQNNGIPEITNPKDDLEKFRIFIKCNINELMKEFNEFIFNLILFNLTSMLQPVIKKLIQEKTNQYTKTIKSLTITSPLIK